MATTRDILTVMESRGWTWQEAEDWCEDVERDAYYDPWGEDEKEDPE